MKLGLALIVLAAARALAPDAPGTVPDLVPPETGRIMGTVLLSPAIAASRMRFRLYSDLGPGAVAPIDQSERNEMANVVVYVESMTPAGPQRTLESQIIAQRNEIFKPHVLPVLRGATVEFLNDDPYFHNVFSLSGAKAFDLGRFGRGQSKAVRFDRPGIVRVFCHIHADMSAVVLVLNTPFFVSPDTLGRFELVGVPPGEYRIVAWHERAKPITRTVSVRAGEASAIDFNIPIPDERPGT